MSTEVLSERYLACTYAHSGATVAGTFYLINNVPMLALNDADANDDNVFVHEADKVRVPKATGQTWTPGDRIYWDNGNSEFTTAPAAGANTIAGYAAEGAASADAEGKIVLRQWLDIA